MIFVNLEWVMSLRRTRHFEVARVLKISEGALCNRLTGKTEFTQTERARVSEYLQYQEQFLFERKTPPASARLQPASDLRPLAEEHLLDDEGYTQRRASQATA